MTAFLNAAPLLSPQLTVEGFTHPNNRKLVVQKSDRFMAANYDANVDAHLWERGDPFNLRDRHIFFPALVPGQAGDSSRLSWQSHHAEAPHHERATAFRPKHERWIV